jgi:hypothetical protein
MLDVTRVELRIRASRPYGRWIRALKLMGYSVVGLDMAEAEASSFQQEAGEEVRCFVHASGSGLPSVDSCEMADAIKRRRPPALLTVGPSDDADEIDAYIGAHPNRLEGLELRLADVRGAYLASPEKTFEWSSRLARAAGARGMPILVSSSATCPEELATPLTKKAFAEMLKTGRRSAGVRERKLLGRLERVVSTRRRTEQG